MIKEYFKLKDIDEDISAIKAKIESLKKGSPEYIDFKDYLSGLKVRRKALIRKNAGNATFFHWGIPPAPRKFSQKQKLLDELYKEKREEELRHARTEESIQLRIKEVKKS